MGKSIDKDVLRIIMRASKKTGCAPIWGMWSSLRTKKLLLELLSVKVKFVFNPRYTGIFIF